MKKEVFTNEYMNRILKLFGRFFLFTLAITIFSLAIFTFSNTQVYAEGSFVFTSHLELGVVSNDVKELQTLLNSKGYDVGIPDGKFGPMTKEQVILFQKDNGLTPDGIIGQRSRAFLNGASNISPISSLPRTLKLLIPRMNGADVKDLQIFLNSKGYDVGILDGYFGPKTQSAVVLFQTANNLTPDGEVGKITRNLINTTSVSNPQRTFSISGCSGKIGYSTTTGVSCSTVFLPIGCNSSSIYSTSTGLSCATGLPPASAFKIVQSGYNVKRILNTAYATVPSSITLAVGSTAPVGGVTNVAIPGAGGTDTTGVITGYVATSADKIKFTVTNGGAAASTITINGVAYTSGADYQIIPTTSLLTIVVTTTEAGKITAVRTFIITGPILGADGLTYGIVIGADGKNWLDRNLGATRVATSFDDYQSYGSLFQWGRGADGHQLITHTSATAATPVNGSTFTLATSDTPGNNLFIKQNDFPNDWRDPQNDNLWQGVNGVNNVCPAGFRLPTNTEQGALVTAAGITNSATAYSSSLKLTAAGYRHGGDALANLLGVYGLYWSSSVSGTYASSFSFIASAVTPAGISIRNVGFAVRCIGAATIATATIVGVTVPVSGATPTATITDTTEYTATISWSPTSSPFVFGTTYTATITIAPKTGYTLTGIPANFFTVAGATATNNANSGVVSAVFPVTWSTIATVAIAGVTVPVTGATPTATITDTTEYTATISWSPSDGIFDGGTVYTATITITPKTGYTLTGIPANFFTVAGATATNSANSGVVSAVFPATQAYATVPSSITLAVGSTAPVGGVTNVAIPGAGGTDTTGVITGYVATTADKIKFTVVDGGSATSTITINGGAYTSGTDYQIVPTTSLPTIVVTTTEAGKITTVRTFVITGPILGADGLTYGIVMGADGKKWLDRNLGATRVATSATDYLAYGSLFQWGRGADGHQLITHTSATAATSVNGDTYTLAISDTPDDNLFIKSPGWPDDWRESQNDELWQGVNGVNNVCPAGFRLPTNTEQQTLITAAGITDMATAYSSSLKFTVAGFRTYLDAYLYDLGTTGYYWSSSVSDTSALNFYFNDSFLDPAYVDVRTYGFTVRCLKD